MSGFGKHSGPAAPPSSQPLFGTSPRPPSSPPHQSPPFPYSGPTRSPSVRSPPLAYESSGLAPSAYQSTGGPRRPEALGRVRSPPLSFERIRPVASPYPSAGAHGPTSSPTQWVDGQRNFSKDDDQINQRPSAVSSFVSSRNSGTSISAKISRFEQLRRTKSPPSHTLDEDISRNSDRTVLRSYSDLYPDNGNQLDPARTRSPPLPFRNDNSIEPGHHPFGKDQQLALSPSMRDNQYTLPHSYPDLSARWDQSSALSYISSNDSAGSLMNELVHVNVPKKIGSPPNNVLQKNTRVFQKESKRPSISPPRVGARTNALSSTPDSQISQRTFSPVNNTAVEDASTRTTAYPVAKRTRSPPLPAADNVIQGKSYSILDDTEREIQAKAKRLARFKQELTEPSENKQDIAERSDSASRPEQSILERQKFAGNYFTESAEDFTNGNNPSDFEGLNTSSVIMGLCPDMCPEAEREERERKGDLDHYERVDGDRNQTNKFLAVKKYNRTAEREANLIRPMPVLQKTFDYLLNLLDQPYDDRFLGMYNFLWDRMRAIRMDLRMQHIFIQEVITMLEQMIRLHIIAMHELCEYTKGEGFSEGFDAHLNIEQMNKTSVELFQMYDDHRKKGIDVPTEKEFRGYYALLKLDKHPGYKVEPSELSLDLAKMTPEIRQTPEVLFARDVARACRTSNFIAFFRLARKASYLQACLMHAHFAKLRTQALASLHSGLQNNQGLPVAHVAKWLAVEEEDIESLLEHHGFFIKEFEQPYMVKEGPFLNGDQDYPTKLSKLVHQKRSRKIADDVSPTLQFESLPAQESKEIQRQKVYKLEKKIVASTFMDSKSSIHELDEEMPDLGTVSSPKVGSRLQPKAQKSKIAQQSQEDHQAEGAYISPWDFSLVHSPPVSQPDKLKDVEKPNDQLFKVSSEKKMLPGLEGMLLLPVPSTASQEKRPSGKSGNDVENTVPQIVVSYNSKGEGRPDINKEKEHDEVMEILENKGGNQANFEDEEVAQAKLKLIIRCWKRRCTKQRVLREQRQIVANAALSSLSLGPPIRMARDQLSSTSDFDIERVLRERDEKHELSWSMLNISDVIIDILATINPGVRCLCWKIVLFSQINNLGYKLERRRQVKHVEVDPWLFSKLMPSKKYEDLLISSSGLSIWKKCAPNQSGNDLTCCLSVVRGVKSDSLDQTIDGANAIVFPVSGNIPWNVQKAHLQKLLMSIPSGSSLPLLVLCGSHDKEASDPSFTIVDELGLNDIDNSRVSNFLVVSLIGDEEGECLEGFHSVVRLREGLQWLASKSPPQPDIQCIKTRELMLTHLNRSMEVLEKMNDYEVGPNHCITAFNEALDWSQEEIAAAAKSNPTKWPCPEIALLQDYSEEHMLVKWYLPSIGWSSAARIEALFSALRESKLPAFPDATPWFDEGANSHDEIENLKSQLEDCLTGYLTELSGIMTFHLAIKEAYVMLQKSARLELHDSSYYVIPKWTSVFRRIFNWQLTKLSNGDFSSAYVLRHHYGDPTSYVHDELGLQEGVSSAYLVQPSLDEMIVCCTPLLPIRGQPQLEAFQPPPVTDSNGVDRDELIEDERTSAQFVKDRIDHVTRELNTTVAEVNFAGKTPKETDKLSKLLEQCNVVQNSIDEKLFLYF